VGSTATACAQPSQAPCLRLMASLRATRQSPGMALMLATGRGNCPSHPARGSHIDHRLPENPCRLPRRGTGLERSHGPLASPPSCVAPKPAGECQSSRGRRPVLSCLHDASRLAEPLGCWRRAMGAAYRPNPPFRHSRKRWNVVYSICIQDCSPLAMRDSVDSVIGRFVTSTTPTALANAAQRQATRLRLWRPRSRAPPGSSSARTRSVVALPPPHAPQHRLEDNSASLGCAPEIRVFGQ
jgi:hypothetical protein